MARARLTLLGGFAARRADGGAVLLPCRKAEALLAFLACRPRGPQPRARLAALLWGDRGEPQARHSLSQALLSIRQTFGDSAGLLVADRAAVALRAEQVEVDALELEALAAGDAVPDLEAAAGLYRGPLLDGFGLREAAFEEWLAGERARLHEVALAVLLKLAARQAAGGDGGAAAATLQRALALDPLSEEAHRRLIRLHLERAGFNAAVRQYRQCAEILKRELGTGPEPSTQTLYREAMDRLAGPPVEPATDARSAPCRATIAVMPLVDSGAGGGRRHWLADGLTHDVIRRLARLRHLSVIARGTVFALEEQAVGPGDASCMLDVDYVVSGAVRRRCRRLTVTVSLVERRTARVVWAETFDHPLGETLRVLDELGDRIAAAIAGEVEVTERDRALLRPPGSLDAWGAHHRGLWHMYRFTGPDNDQAQRFFQLAVGLDPSFARAHAGLSFTHFQNAFLLRTGEREREIDRAVATAGQGLIADDRDPAAHWAMGRALWLRGRHAESVAELERAVELCPSFALGHYALAFVHCQSGDPRAAIAAADRSRQLSPFDPLLFAMLASRALAHVRLGQVEEAADWAVKAAARPNAHAHVQAIAAHCLAAADRADEARRVAASIRKARPNYGCDDFLAAFRFAPDAAALFRRGAERIWS